MVRVPRFRPYRSGPWIGVRQHAATVTDTGKYLETLRNGYLKDVDQAPVAVGRPGFALAGLGGTAQLGDPGFRRGQWVGQFTKADGTELSVCIVGGKLYVYNWGSDAFSEPVTTANFTTAGITLDRVARCHAVVFANRLIVSDGINLPWAWDGTAGSGGLLSLTNAAVAYGQPWVYYGKLFLIKGTTTASRISILWSEEGQPNTGYESGYNNAWDVYQTSQAIFYAGIGTNDAMILCRANSATRIMGEVTTNFRSTATREGVHEFVGSVSPSSMIVHKEVVYFFANDGRIMQVLPGAAAEEIAIGAREFMQTQAVSSFTVVEGMVWDAGSYGEYLIWAVAGPGVDDPDTLLVVSPRTGELAGIWSGWRQTRMGAWKDSDGTPVLVHIGGENSQASEDGYVYAHGTPLSGLWTDGFEDGPEAIPHTLATHAMGWDEITEKIWDIADLSLITAGSMTGIGVQAETPYGAQEPITLNSIVVGGAQFDISKFDEAEFAGDALEQKVAVGVETVGRWAKWSVNHLTLAESFQMQAMAVRAAPLTDAPDVR